MDTTFIYGLNDPETGECRYVGKADNPKKRLAKHLAKGGRKCYCRNWINSLTIRGLSPLLEVLQEVPKTDWKLWERVWIRASRKIGMKLTNWHDGGQGSESGEKNPFFGKKHTPETLSKLIGKIRTPEHCANISAAKKGKTPSLETRAKMSAVRKGKKQSLSARAAHRVKKKGASSRFHGVCKSPDRNKWRAFIGFFNKVISLGRFDNEVDAAKAYDLAALKYCGNRAVLNFPNN